MPQPEVPLHVLLTLCDKTLQEVDDGVHSIIRLIDTIEVRPVPTDANEPLQIIRVQVFLSAKFPTHDEGSHIVELYLERPDGEVKHLGKTLPTSVPKSRHPNVPRGIVLRLGFTVLVKMLGTHYLAAHIDGREVSRAPFTLVPEELVEMIPADSLGSETQG